MPVASTAGPDTPIRIRAPLVASPPATSSTSTLNELIVVPWTTE